MADGDQEKNKPNGDQFIGTHERVRYPRVDGEGRPLPPETGTIYHSSDGKTTKFVPDPRPKKPGGS